MESELKNAAVPEICTTEPAEAHGKGLSDQRHQKGSAGKHKKQKTVTGAATFSPEEVAHRKAKWEARQGSRNMENLRKARQSLPIASLR